MPKDAFIDVSLEEVEFVAALQTFERMEEAITPRWLKSTQRRQAAPIIADMKRGSKSARLEPMIGVTTAKKRAGDLGIKIGVIKNDRAEFPAISAPAFAAIIEYGTAERYRQLRALGFITGRVSTGAMPAAPFLRPAWDRGVTAFMDSVVAAIEAKVIREAQ